MFPQSISKMSQIQLLLNLTFSIVSPPLILNKLMLPSILQNFMGTYAVVFDMKSIIFVTLENSHPLNRQDFLILFMTR